MLYITISLFTGNRIKYIIPIAIITFLSFSILGSIRNFANSDSISIENIIEKSENYSISNYQLQLRDEAVLEYYKNPPILYGSSYFAIFTSIIPRSILGDLKPEMLDGKIGKEVFRNYNSGYPIHPVTEGILNFGLLGLFVLFILGFIYTHIIRSATNLLSYSIFAYLILFSQTGYSTYWIYAFQYFIVIMIISFVTRINYNGK
jgi:hypothetical protein